ncbi:cardioacceleratory peptide receptor [Trichonephila clavipes]|nr:cardioacceleratory peptide receptor [Trichonephila clavipes]
MDRFVIEGRTSDKLLFPSGTVWILVSSLVVRASDSRPEGLGASDSLVGRITSAGDWRIFPSPPVPRQNCGGGDRWCRHLSSLRGISPSKFELSPAWCSRPRPTTGRKARWLVASAWGISAIFSIPSIFLSSKEEVKGMSQCWIDLDPWQWQVYITLVAVSLFFLPALIIAACYTIIVYTIWTKSRLMSYPKLSKSSIADSKKSWLNELKIDKFDGLKNLMIADQMKNRCSPECKEHYLDIWEEPISLEMLADKLEAFDNIRRSLPSGPRRHVKASETVNDGRQVLFRKPERTPKREHSHQVPNERSPLRCYGCGKQGVIKSRCPTCNLNASKKKKKGSNQSHQCLHSSDEKPSIDPNRHNFLWNNGTCMYRHRIFTFTCWGKDVPDI